MDGIVVDRIFLHGIPDLPSRIVILFQIIEGSGPVSFRVQRDRFSGIRFICKQVDDDFICCGRANPIFGNRHGDLHGFVLNAQTVSGNVEFDLAGRIFRKDKVDRFGIELIAGRGNRLQQAVGPVCPERPAEALQVADDQRFSVGSRSKGNVLSVAVLHRHRISVFEPEQLEGCAGQQDREHFGIPFHQRNAGIAARSSAGRIHHRSFFNRLFVVPKLDRIGIRDISGAENPRLIPDHEGGFIGNLGKDQRVCLFFVLNNERIAGRCDRQGIVDKAQVGGQHILNRQHIGGGIQILRILVDDDLKLRNIAVLGSRPGQQRLVHIGKIGIIDDSGRQQVIPSCGILQVYAVLRGRRRFIQRRQSRRIPDDQRIIDKIVGIKAAVSLLREAGYGDGHALRRIDCGYYSVSVCGRVAVPAQDPDSLSLKKLQVGCIEGVLNHDPILNRAEQSQRIAEHGVGHPVDLRIRTLNHAFDQVGLDRDHECRGCGRGVASGPGRSCIPMQGKIVIPLFRRQVQPILIDPRFEADHNIPRLTVGCGKDAALHMGLVLIECQRIASSVCPDIEIP